MDREDRDDVARDIPLQTIFRGVMPFLLAPILGTLSLTAMPRLATFLPRLMY